MKDFVGRARAYSEQNPDAVDPSTERWAARAFSVIAILGTMDIIEDDEIGQALAVCLGSAPTSVLASGLLHTMDSVKRAEQ